MDHVHVGKLAGNWWVLPIRGALAIVFGVLAFALPGITLASLVLLFGAYALVEGAMNLVAAVRGQGDGSWWVLALEGIVSIAAGLIALAMPGLATVALLYVIAAWAVVTGIFEIAAAIRLRAHIQNEWWLALGGVVSVLFGVLVMVAPGAGALAVVFWAGAYGLAFGITLVALAFRLRRWHGEDRGELRRAA